MTTPARDTEYPSPIWIPPRSCEHPYEYITLQGQFPPENPELSVFVAHCLHCGSRWDQTSTHAPWDQLLRKIMNGQFGAVSSTDSEISHKVEWQRQNYYSAMNHDLD